MHVGIANPRWRGKCSRYSRGMCNPQFYVSGNRPIVNISHELVTKDNISTTKQSTAKHSNQHVSWVVVPGAHSKGQCWVYGEFSKSAINLGSNSSSSIIILIIFASMTCVKRYYEVQHKPPSPNAIGLTTVNPRAEYMTTQKKNYTIWGLFWEKHCECPIFSS